MDKIKVCVVGDAALDIRREGTSTRTSPEDPDCKVLSDLMTTYELGMAGNVAAWLVAQEECQVTLCGLVAGDEAGFKVSELCAERNIYACFPRFFDKRYLAQGQRTTVKERICHVEGERIHQLVRCDCDMTSEITERECLRLIKEVEKSNLVVVADYGKGVFKGEHGGSLLRWIGDVATRSATLVVNSKFPNPWQRYPIDALICNESEAMCALIQREGDRALETENLIVTQGARGVCAHTYNANRERTLEIQPSLAKNIVDVTGAGDSFTAGFALHYHRHKSVGDAVVFGQWMAAQCVARIGCGAPTRVKG